MGEGQIVQAVEDADQEDLQPSAIKHSYRLRPDFIVQIELPADLNAREAERLADFIKTLPFEA